MHDTRRECMRDFGCATRTSHNSLEGSTVCSRRKLLRSIVTLALVVLWASSSNAQKRENKTSPLDEKYRIANKSYAQASDARKPAPDDASPSSVFASFQLTRGRGVKVCEAYRERLNRSWYPRWPMCDRPEDDRVSGFRKLGRVSLSPEQIQPFWASVKFFLSTRDPDRWKLIDESDRKLGLPRQYGDREQQLRTIRGESSFHMYGFDPLIDIDNDGIPDPVVMWRQGDCAYFDGPLPRSWVQVPVVLNTGGDAPDGERTRRLFGHPVEGYRLPSGKMTERFRPIGLRMGIFWFDGLYYMDAFFDEWGDFRNQRRSDPEIGNTLGVFLAQGGKVEQVCEYRMEDFLDVGGVSMRKQLDAWKRAKRSGK